MQVALRSNAIPLGFTILVQFISVNKPQNNVIIKCKFSISVILKVNND